MHDLGIVIASKDKSGSAHICSKLVDLMDGLIKNPFAQPYVTKVSLNKIICLRFNKLRELKIDTPDPKAVFLQTLFDIVPLPPA